MLFCRLLASGIRTITVSLHYGIGALLSTYGHERVKSYCYFCFNIQVFDNSNQFQL